MDRNQIEAEWPQFERTLVSWWAGDIRSARESDVRDDSARTLLYLPFPYSSAGGSEAAFPEMYAWDTYFVNLAMMAYGREEIVRWHLLNQLFMIERYGFVLNGNRTFYLGRSQPPLHADMMLRYVDHTGDLDFARRAYPVLAKEVTGYWCAPHHMTPSGLHTNRDILDMKAPTKEEVDQLPLIGDLSPALLAEAETGLDFCANYEGEVRNFNPLITNCVLVRYFDVLAILAERLQTGEVERWSQMRDERAALIQKHCWNDDVGFFLEYNYVENRQNPLFSLCGFLPMWAGFATREQAERLIQALPRFMHPYGLSQTDVEAPSPHKPRFENVQWNYPAGWPPFQVLVSQSLRFYGYEEEASACELSWLNGCLRQYKLTGSVYEKYNVVDGSLVLPKERQKDIPPLHGWSTASCLLAGRNLFGSKVQ